MSISPQLVLFRYCQSNRTQHRFHWRLLQEFVPGPVRLPSFPELLRQYLDEHEQPVKFYTVCFSFQFKSVLTKETSLCQALLLGDERKRGRATNAEGSWERCAAVSLTTTTAVCRSPALSLWLTILLLTKEYNLNGTLDYMLELGRWTSYEPKTPLASPLKGDYAPSPFKIIQSPRQVQVVMDHLAVRFNLQTYFPHTIVQAFNLWISSAFFSGVHELCCRLRHSLGLI